MAITLMTVLIGGAGFVIHTFDRRIELLEASIKISPTQQDVRDLRMSMEKLGDKFDAFKDQFINRSKSEI